jgi:DNA-binding PadR family transcriptional regulator
LKYRYNEMKRLILSLFRAETPLTGQSVAERLRTEKKLAISLRAVQMALMRYHRQGLLHREKRSGRYVYSLTDKGGRRLQWLHGNENRPQIKTPSSP